LTLIKLVAVLRQDFGAYGLHLPKWRDDLRQRKMRRIAALSMVLLGGCSLNDSHLARRAQTMLLGMNEVALQTCLGGPDQKSTFENTEILTYYATSTSSSSFSLPVVGGIGFSNGGYCHAIIRLDDGVVTGVRYTGENRAFAAPDAYCAPIVGDCVNDPPTPGGGAAPVAMEDLAARREAG
jgi:hypothetical protein